MTEDTQSIVVILLLWAAFSLARTGYQAKRIARAVEALNDLAQKGRRHG